MTDQLLTQFRAIIERNCLWLELLPGIYTDIWKKVIGDELVPFSVPVLKFQVRYRRKSFKKGRVISVSLYDLDVAVRKYVTNDRIRQRVESAKLTLDDIEEIFRIATSGTIRLKLFDFDRYQ
ncbi:MAG: hypothetical protein LUC85_03250 [Bacteroidales bacterium]|nr:hypothetical protein [Bacteroidales bacterium]